MHRACSSTYIYMLSCCARKIMPVMKTALKNSPSLCWSKTIGNVDKSLFRYTYTCMFDPSTFLVLLYFWISSNFLRLYTGNILEA